MYQFSGKLKTLSIALMILGLLGVGYGFYSAPKTVEEAKEILAKQHHDGHGDAHATSVEDSHAETSHSEDKKEEHGTTAVHTENHDDAHAEHVFHQMQNRPWAAFFVALMFFLGVTLLVLAFYASQRVAQSGWSVVLFRVMEAISANLHYVSVIMLGFLIATFMHMNHLFPWMAEGVFDPTSPNFDCSCKRKKMVFKYSRLVNEKYLLFISLECL